MNTYCVTLTLRSPSGTPWQADTMFGHLCWLLAWKQHDEKKLREWLERYKNGAPPFLLSDGFPFGLLPRPVPSQEAKPDGLSKQIGMERSKDRKRLKSIEWLTFEEFKQVCEGKPLELPKANERRECVKEMKQRVTFKNQISRLTGTTGDDGNLYPFVEEVLWDRVSFFVRLADDDTRRIIEELFSDLQASGYGKRKSVGYGNITRCDWEECRVFAPLPNANAFVSLSHFVPAKADPTDGQWRVHVKYGKVSGGLSHIEKPFKYPLVMLKPGSWFKTPTPEREWYGRLVDDVSSVNNDVVQYGLAFAVPMEVK